MDTLNSWQIPREAGKEILGLYLVWMGWRWLLHSSPDAAVFWICDYNSVGNTPDVAEQPLLPGGGWGGKDTGRTNSLVGVWICTSRMRKDPQRSEILLNTASHKENISPTQTNNYTYLL